jgi:ribosomal protein S18 acetylase RimI-like enzyme
MNSLALPSLHKSVYEVVPFEQMRLPSAQDLARLHLTLLPNSPISLLGELFARSFYYKLLPKQGLLFGAVAYVDQQPVGFIVVTDKPNEFMRSALKRHFLYLVGVVMVSVLMNPIKRLAAIREAWQIMSSLPQLEIPDSEGELLSFGVLPEYRLSEFGQQSGHYVAADLLNTIVDPLKQRGMDSVRAIVDTDNQVARSFYRKHGWQLRARKVEGWQIPSLELVWYLS